MCRSIKMRSGRSEAATLTAASPRDAWPMTAKRPSAARMWAIPSRNSALSSTSNTLMGMISSRFRRLDESLTLSITRVTVMKSYLAATSGSVSRPERNRLVAPYGLSYNAACDQLIAGGMEVALVYHDDRARHHPAAHPAATDESAASHRFAGSIDGTHPR